MTLLGRHAAALLFAFCTVSYPASTQDNDAPSSGTRPLQVVGLQIPWLLDQDRPGPYNQVIEDLIGSYRNDVVLHYFPLKRATRHFFNGAADCFFGGNYDDIYFKDTLLTRDNLTISEPFNIVSIRVFTRPGTKPITKPQDLLDLRLAVDQAIGGAERIQARYLQKHGDAMTAVNVGQSYALLMQNRVDAVLMMDYDYELYAARYPEMERLSVSPYFELERVEDAMMCKKGERTSGLIEHFNKHLAEMKSTGALGDALLPDLSLHAQKNAEYQQARLTNDR